MKHTIYALTMFALAACTSPQEEAKTAMHW